LRQKIIEEFGESIEMFVHTDGSYPVSCAVQFNKDGKTDRPQSDQINGWTLENVMKNERHGTAIIKTDLNFAT